MIFILLFVVEFEFSLGPITWLYLAEIMTEKGLSIAILLNWIMTIIMAIVTPFVISGTLFIVFGILCAIVSLKPKISSILQKSQFTYLIKHSIYYYIYSVDASASSSLKKLRVSQRLKYNNCTQVRKIMDIII